MVSVFAIDGVGNLKRAISPNNFHFFAVGGGVRFDFDSRRFWFHPWKQLRPLNWRDD